MSRGGRKRAEKLPTFLYVSPREHRMKSQLEALILITLLVLLGIVLASTSIVFAPDNVVGFERRPAGVPEPGTGRPPERA